MGQYLFSYFEVFGQGVPDYVTGVTDLQVHHGASGVRLYSTTRPGGGVAAFSIGAGQTAVLDSFSVPENLLQLTPPAISFLETGGVSYALTLGLNADRLQAYRLDANGDPIRELSFRAGGFDLAQVTDLVSTQVNGETVGYGSLRGHGMVRLSFDGSPTMTASELTLGGPGSGHAVSDMQQVHAGGRDYIVASFATADVLTSYRVNAGGGLQRMADVGIDNGLWIDTPNVMTQVQMGAQTYIILGAALSSSLSVIAFADDGTMHPVDHLIDDLETRFNHVAALTSIGIDGRNFVIAGGGDDGLSLFVVLPDGRLLHLDSFADTLETRLTNVTAIEAAHIGDDLHVFAASETDPLITRMTVDVSDIGENLVGAAGHDNLTGGGRDDILSGGGGNDTLRGGDGDDVLMDGDGADRLTGGAGRDIFVLALDGIDDVIEDFQLHHDRLDLSGFYGLRDWRDLTILSRSWGAEIRFESQVIILRSANGASLSASDFSQSDFLTQTRLSTDNFVPSVVGQLFEGTPNADTYTGDTQDDTINGLAGNDRLSGADGDDQISGGGQNDRLYGGAGHDQLSGDGGADTLQADGGDDSLTGGAGADVLRAGDGDDRLWGGTENDALYGDGGADFLYGDQGNDVLSGGDQDDRLAGGEDDDTLRGGNGADRLFGETGDDRMFGEADIDFLSGGDGNDLLDGGAGADNLFGDQGRDTILAGDGNDRLFGGTENDVMLGGAGDDRMFGEAGNDVLQGETGNNVMFGGAGNDVLDALEGADLLYGEAGHDVLRAGGGDDLLFGGAGSDRIFGQGGFDRINGGDDSDLLDGGADNDTIRGGGGIDRLYGMGGQDRLAGGDDRDLVRGNDGNDLLYGQHGDDTMLGGPGDDLLFGGGNHDDLYGNSSSDTLDGNGGNDQLDGGGGHDRLIGGAGYDTLIGGTGQDVLIGGGNADQFVFGNNFGRDTITDFEADNIHERIDLSDVTQITSYGDLLLNHMTRSGSNVVIEDGLGNSITIRGVTMADLDSSDFLF